MAWSSSALSHLIAMNGHFTSTMTLLLPFPVVVVVIFFNDTQSLQISGDFFFVLFLGYTSVFFRFATFTRSPVVYLSTHLAHVPFICNDSLLICFYQQIECNDFSLSLITPFNSIWNVLFFLILPFSVAFLRQKNHSFLIDWS